MIDKNSGNQQTLIYGESAICDYIVGQKNTLSSGKTSFRVGDNLNFDNYI